MRTAVWLCLLVVLAGCNAPVGAGGGGTADTPPAATAAPVPEDSTLAPGLADEGVVDPERLTDAHTGAISDDSYTLVANRTERYGNGTVRSGLRIRVELAADRGYHVRTATAGPDGPVFLGTPPASGAFWSNGSVYVRRLTNDDSTIYNEFRPREGGAGTWTYWVTTVPFGGGQADPTSFYTGVFRSVAVDTVERDTDGDSVVYRLHGSELREASFTGEFADVRNVSLRATVTERGLVRSLRLRFTGTVDGEPVRVEWQVRYRNVSATTVERPGWFERAVQSS